MILYKITFKNMPSSTMKQCGFRSCFFLRRWAGKTFIARKSDDERVYEFWFKDNSGRNFTYHEWLENIVELP